MHLGFLKMDPNDSLANFWKEGCLAVKSQLAGRYPKHEWR